MIQQAPTELAEEFFSGVKSLSFLRLDLPDPIAGGNKSYKLKYHLEAFRNSAAGSILSFGGAYSNHIAALAYAGKVNNIPTIGIVRGEELNQDSNSVLRFASECGMQLHFVTREDYRLKQDTEFLNRLGEKFGAVCVVPEGGGGSAGVRGCREILSEECDAFEEIILPVGTGTTMVGIIQTAKRHQVVNGIAVVADHSLKDNIAQMLNEDVSCSWNLTHDFTMGGYANTSDELDEFIITMKKRLGLPLDHVYSGKALFALHKEADSGRYRDKNVLMIHTGGYAFL
jgi:1-aminocyclopropane-1-carboxylate deaminase